MLKARTLLDVNVSLDGLNQQDITSNPEFKLTDRILNVVAENTTSVKAGNDISATCTASVVRKTLNYYDLDYTRPDYFKTDIVNSLSPMNSPIASYSIGSSSSGSGNRYHSPYLTTVMSGSDDSDVSAESRSKYKPPVSTPILVELIDTPGVQKNDLIPFLEKGLDSRLATDVLRNLINNSSSESRSRVKTMITGSGMSELNAAMDGYLLCYSSIPETANQSLPPSYDDTIAMEKNGKSSKSNVTFGGDPLEETGYEAIEILKALYNAIMEAWKQYTNYHIGWEEGKEFDVYSLNYSFKHLWKKRSVDANLTKEGLTKRAKQIMPPILIAVTHVDHELSSPVLIDKGRELAKKWNCGFIEVSCEFDNWRNVEEALSFLIRDRIEDLREKKAHKIKGFGL